jgi:hypothetical protein
MKITSELLARFNGGQVEVQNPVERYLYRGEIKVAAVEDGNIKVACTWMAKAVNYPEMPPVWMNGSILDFEASLELFVASDKQTPDRLVIQSGITYETVVFFPADGSKLDPAQVDGLTLPVSAT